ncbi:MAG: hypothetical protein LBS10_06800 [Gracilibacteraceae bacterium]|nr:hypothetical protein [Gracilibacteraceae bacterium]
MKNCICFLLCAVLLLSCAGCAVPQDSLANERIIQIACGEDFTLFLFDSGQIRGIGKNTSGQLGVGDTADRYELTDVLLTEPAAEIGVSDDTAYALTADKRLYLWGDNRYRQVADIDMPAVMSPLPRNDWPGELKQFSLGWISCYVLTADNEIYGWGNKLALTNLADLNYDPIYQATLIRQNHVYTTYSDERYEPVTFKMIAAKDGIYYGLDEEDLFFGMMYGELRVAPQPEEIIKLSVGRGFYALLSASGKLYLGGDNLRGELGRGDNRRQGVPELQPLTVTESLQDITVGPNHILALTRDSRVWAWGDNTDGQLGLSGAEDVTFPMEVSMPEDIIYIATGFHNSYFIGVSGQLYACGANDYGQLLTGDQEKSPEPVRAELNAALPEPRAVIYPHIDTIPISE